jgi:hypothetical protein
MVHSHAVWKATMGRLDRAVRRAVLPSLVLIAVSPASALAGDPLLSGYGGPGGGEQAVLGDKLLPPSKGGGGSLQAQPATTGTGAAPTQLTTRPAAPATSGTGPASSGGSSRSGARGTGGASDRARRDANGSDAAGRKAGSSQAPLGAATPEIVTYPSSARGSGGLPLSGGDVAIGLLGALVLALVALGLRRLVSGAERPPGA